jgi:hypothetical protein
MGGLLLGQKTQHIFQYSPLLVLGRLLRSDQGPSQIGVCFQTAVPLMPRLNISKPTANANKEAEPTFPGSRVQLVPS